jgi:hypothetical protein
MTLFIAVPADDHDAISALEPGLPLGMVGPGADGPEVTLEGRTLAPHEVLLGAVCGLTLGAAGRAQMEALRASMAERHDTAPLPVTDLGGETKTARPLAALRAVAAALAEGRADQARLNAALMASVAELRRAHAGMQENFARLEDYLQAAGLAQRSLQSALLPAVGPTALILRGGETLEQRLPRDGAGLSDVAVSVSAMGAPRGGTLTARLFTAEDDAEHALWKVDATQIASGWLRLSLPVSLGAAARTAVLRLEWEGAEPLPLEGSVAHPDARFRARIGDAVQARTVALRTWTFVPGCEAPVPLDGILPGGSVSGPRLVPLNVMQQAINLTPANRNFRIIEDIAAIQVHVMPRGLSAAVLPRILPPGVTELRARIQTRAELAPRIEYAMAVAPAADRHVPGDPLPAFAEGALTAWHPLPPVTEGELHLPLPAPLGGAHDFYMLVRLPPGAPETDAWGWSTFSAIRFERP